MNVNLIFKVIKTPRGWVEKIETVEYVDANVDLTRPMRLFELQRPVDLREIIQHSYVQAQAPRE